MHMRSEPKLPQNPQKFCRVSEPKLQNFVPKPMVLVRFPQLPAAVAQKVANKVGKPMAALAPRWHCQGACKGAQAGDLKFFLLHSLGKTRWPATKSAWKLAKKFVALAQFRGETWAFWGSFLGKIKAVSVQL